MKTIYLLVAFLSLSTSNFGQTAAENYYNEGLKKMQLQNYREAIIDFNKAIRLNPKYGKAYNDRAYAKSV